jgi:hypothetical protein
LKCGEHAASDVRLVAALALLAILAGCTQPAPPAPAPVAVAPPTPSYDLIVRVSGETLTGPAMVGAEVVAYVLQGEAIVRSVPAVTDRAGAARFHFTEPVQVALRASAPGWTREGTVATVQRPSVVDAATGALASEDTVFLPLYRIELRQAAHAAVSTETVQPGSAGSIMAPAATAALLFPEGAAAGYLARLSAADVRLHWNDTATQRADLSAGLAWNGGVWVEGPPAGPGLLPAAREAAYAGTLPQDGRPGDVSRAALQAVAVTHSAVLGDVPLSFDVSLRFAGHEPPGLPAPCGHSTRCSPIPPLPPT